MRVSISRSCSRSSLLKIKDEMEKKERTAVVEAYWINDWELECACMLQERVRGEGTGWEGHMEE